MVVGLYESFLTLSLYLHFLLIIKSATLWMMFLLALPIPNRPRELLLQKEG